MSHGHDSHAAPATTPHTSRAKEPSIVAESQNVLGKVAGFFVLLAVVLVIGKFIWWVKTPAQPKTPSVANIQTATPAQPRKMAETLVLAHECFTPCVTPTVNYKFRLVWGDSPLLIEYPGGIVVERKDKDTDYKAPAFNQSGSLKLSSLDPLRPNFRVQVYRIVFR